MKTETKHTPTPWHYSIDFNSDNHFNIESAEAPQGARGIIARTPSRDPAIRNNPALDVEEANAAFIVEACNGYDKLQRDNAALLGAFKQIGAHISETVMFYSEGDHGNRVYVADVIRAAIAQAESEELT